MSLPDIKPLVEESSTSESTTVDVVMADMKDHTLTIPDYQRDGDQWDDTTRSLLVESVINNLTIPAFFFEVYRENGIEKNDVVDGQQRLTTLYDFFQHKFRLVGADDAPYISPDSIHYAGKTFDELPSAYQQSFKKYRLAVIKLRSLGGMKLEIFRRINQGGTPLSGQDIRLAYYGEGSKSVSLIRLAGIYDADRTGSKRFIDSAKSKLDLDLPWKDEIAKESWKDWWKDKQLARGQTPSEMFLWSIVATQPEKLNSLLINNDALGVLNVRFNRAIDEAMDACCAQLRYQDENPDSEPLLMRYDEIAGKFFPHFEWWMKALLSSKGVSLSVQKHRMMAIVIGAVYKNHIKGEDLTAEHWTNIVEFIRRPADVATVLDCPWPMSRGRWDGDKGYRAQMEATSKIISKIYKSQ
jgi:hypothetical protein